MSLEPTPSEIKTRKESLINSFNVEGSYVHRDDLDELIKIIMTLETQVASNLAEIEKLKLAKTQS